MSLFNHPCQKLYRETGFIKGAVTIATMFQSKGLLIFVNVIRDSVGKLKPARKAWGV